MGIRSALVTPEESASAHDEAFFFLVYSYVPLTAVLYMRLMYFHKFEFFSCQSADRLLRTFLRSLASVEVGL